MAKYKHIIWDWNGTLLDDVSYCVDIMNAMLQKRRMPIMTQNQYKRIFDFPVRDYYKKIGFDFGKESFEIVGTEFIVNYHENSKSCGLQYGAKEVLQEISQQGISQSILSAMKQPDLEELVESNNLAHHFIKIIGLNDHYADGKVENGRRWIEELHYDSDNVLMVGDTSHDYEVAKEMGVDCVLVAIGHHPKDKLEKCGVPVLQSLREVLGIVG